MNIQTNNINSKLNLLACIFLSTTITLLLNLLFIPPHLLFTNIVENPTNIDIIKLSLITLSFIWETTILSIIFYFSSKKFFKL